MDYNKFSRKGLIDLVERFDGKTDNSLAHFCEDLETHKVITDWYYITPLELAIEKVIDSKNSLKKTVSETTRDNLRRALSKANAVGSALVDET